MRTIRLLLIIPNLGPGGAQRVFHQQLQAFPSYFQVTGCVFNWDDSHSSDQKQNIFSLDIPAGRSHFGKIYYFLKRIIRLRKMKRSRGIDVSISHLEGADYVNVLSGVGKTICWIHGSKKFDQNIRGLLGFIRQRILMPVLYRQADFIITVSKGIANELRAYLKMSVVPVETIYNGFDIAGIKKQGADKVDDGIQSLQSDGAVIITHCRLSRQKNLSTLLSIFSHLRGSEKVKLVIVGDGELRDSLIEFSRKLGLTIWTVWDKNIMTASSDVFFLGHHDNPLKYLKHADLYVMTSLWEGFPLALCEAIIVGLPVIAADCHTGPREILLPDLEAPQPIAQPLASPLGCLMPMLTINERERIDQWAYTIASMLKNANKHDHAENAGVHMKKFDIDIAIRRTVEVIHKVLKSDVV
ncbi:MAG: glycosyltransferase [Chryseolinea sp.]